MVKPIIGTVHLRPLPGPRCIRESLESIVELALKDVGEYTAGGIDGLIVENSGHLPFSKPHDVDIETAGS